MKVVILAGGYGTRLAEETSRIPKPMVEIGGKPMLWHILNFYAAHNHRDFLIAAGYKSEVIKEYFYHYDIRQNDLFVDLRDGSHRVVRSVQPNWRVGVIDTGLNTRTGGRLARLREYLGAEPFMVTYGDGLCDVDIGALVAFHRGHGKLATVTAVRPPARFGRLDLDGDRVSQFAEKPQTGEGWINGGYFVFEPGIFDYISGDATNLESQALEALAGDGQLMAFQHDRFWQPMDTLREKQLLESIWNDGRAPWAVEQVVVDDLSAEENPRRLSRQRAA